MELKKSNDTNEFEMKNKNTSIGKQTSQRMERDGEIDVYWMCDEGISSYYC